MSTGFHAPTPGQANYKQVITTFDGVTGLQVEEGLVASTSPLVAAVGGTALTEETSLNLSAGFAKQIGADTVLTVDFYSIEVDDRIYRTGDIPVPSGPGQEARSISFYTNALDVESQGVDIVLTSRSNWGGGSASTTWTFAGSFNDFNVAGQSPVGGVNPVSPATIEDIENNYPGERFVLTTNTSFADDWGFLARANYYGKHFDERGTIGAAVNPSLEIGAVTYIDIELNYDITDNVQIALGAVNVFDEFIDEAGPPFSNRLSVGLQYPRRSAANYEGGSYYVKTRFTF